VLCFGSVHCKGVAGAFCVSADSKEDSWDEGRSRVGMEARCRVDKSLEGEVAARNMRKQRTVK
jgi:hypothetical protein